MSAHDRRYTTEAWCSNPACPHHEEAVEVTFESEYGQGWFTPEECDCGGHWLEDKPVACDETGNCCDNQILYGECSHVQ